MNPLDILKRLQEDSLFQDWEKQHHNIFLSHFFCPLKSDMSEKSNWEIGFFNTDTQKISVFRALDSGSFELKPEDDVFKQPNAVVEKLDETKIKTTFSQVVEKLKPKLPELFPQVQMGDGFVILQTMSDQTVWNFTFISKTLQFANVRIDAGSNEVESHQLVNAVQQE